MTLFILEKLLQMSERDKGGGEEGGYLQTVRTADQEKKRGGRGGEGEADAFLLRTCHISGWRRGSRGRQDRGRRDGHSSHDSKTFSNNSWPLLRHFSSVWGSERAGGRRGQPLSDVHSQAQSEDV